MLYVRGTIDAYLVDNFDGDHARFDSMVPLLLRAEPASFASQIAPFLKAHCVACHSGKEPEGGIDFAKYRKSANVEKDYELWEKVVRLIKERQMPPADEPQPSVIAALNVTRAIEIELANLDCASSSHPGRVTIRRLNRSEYNNTIRDLVGLDLKLADAFPSDDVGHGFDNIGDVLSIPPILLEKYLKAAETVARSVMADEKARGRVFPHVAVEDGERGAVVRRNIREFATRAFRRPLSERETERLFGLARAARRQGAADREVLETVISAVLANPHFLFRIERDPAPDDQDGIRDLTPFEIATRMSYFLWSSMPDKELFAAASSGDSLAPTCASAQVRRMLADPKARALVDDFAGQWLQLRDVEQLTPDPIKFPEFDDALRAAMRRETEMFFETIVANRSVLDLLTADFTFVNARLARHYGIEGGQGAEFQRVALGQGRRGILTHASILALTSNPTRTSPVKRGKWILDNILAEPPPPPPPSVPDLAEDGETLGSLREQMEQHRAVESCAVCHRKMDALGFGMENFDAIGRWRDRDGRFPVDASGALPGGKSFRGAVELMKILVEEKETEFCRCLTSKLLTYALGRGLGPYDRCTTTEIVRTLQKSEYRFETLIISIVNSAPFTKREARRPE